MTENLDLKTLSEAEVTGLWMSISQNFGNNTDRRDRGRSIVHLFLDNMLQDSCSHFTRKQLLLAIVEQISLFDRKRMVY